MERKKLTFKIATEILAAAMSCEEEASVRDVALVVVEVVNKFLEATDSDLEKKLINSLGCSILASITANFEAEAEGKA